MGKTTNFIKKTKKCEAKIYAFQPMICHQFICIKLSNRNSRIALDNREYVTPLKICFCLKESGMWWIRNSMNQDFIIGIRTSRATSAAFWLFWCLFFTIVVTSHIHSINSTTNITTTRWGAAHSD